MAIPVERRLEIVTQQIVRAKLFYDIWWLYKGSETRPHIIDTLNDFSEFFRFDEHAHFVSMVIHCAAIWDKRRGNVSLPGVANCILDPRGKTEDKALDDAISGYAKAAQGLVKLRHEAIAHRSAEFDYSEAFTRAAVTPDSIPTMLGEWLNVANQLRKRRNMVDVTFAEVPLQDAQRVIHALGGPDLRPANPLDELFGS